MVYNPSHRHRHVIRQDDPIGAPNAEGISNGMLTAGTATGTALAFDTSATGGTTDGPAAFVPPSVSTPRITPTSSNAPVQSDSTSSSKTSSNEIPMGTVIGACVGAFVGAVVIISIGIWLYRRSDAKHRKRSPSRSARRKSDTWNRLGDDEDKWEGMNKTREVSSGTTIAAGVDTAAEPMEKLTMFKKSSPSIRTAYTTQTHTDEAPTNFNFDHPFAQYHPNLARELASTHETEQPTVKPFTNRAEAVPSWDGGDASVGGSFLSLRSNRLSGTMSPTFDMAIPTPPLTSSDPHRWESAEVINFEGQSAEIVDPSNEASNSNNPFLHDTEIRRKSANNPFFGAQSDQRRPSVSKSKGRDITPGSVTTPPLESKNPFSDDHDTETRTHTAVNSVSSSASNDRAIQSLLAALEVAPEASRVISMQPSVLSANSMYTEEDVTAAFPIPPGSYPAMPNNSTSSS
ncbi:hypothetical protein VKT23_011387 [Stygiomarasmius scandens]|uniref:Uncharacterized protein n=1 Tax=Marasmiellus scandens TaxID=2682957 RepID=A0ABR1JDF0_9AGAR